MFRWLKNWILDIIVAEIQVGAHCGLCGAWMENVLTYRSFERFPDYNEGIRFLFKTNFGTYINSCIDLGEKFTDTKAREFGECLGRDIIYHYQAVSN